MISILIGLSIASLLTAMFAFRHDAGRDRRVLVAYFALFFSIEMLADHFLIPPGVLGIEIAYVCFALTIPFVAITEIFRKLEAANVLDRTGSDSVESGGGNGRND